MLTQPCPVKLLMWEEIFGHQPTYSRSRKLNVCFWIISPLNTVHKRLITHLLLSHICQRDSPLVGGSDSQAQHWHGLKNHSPPMDNFYYSTLKVRKVYSAQCLLSPLGNKTSSQSVLQPYMQAYTAPASSDKPYAVVVNVTKRAINGTKRSY